jgi:hypothetical protein
VDVYDWRNTGWFIDVDGARDLFGMIGAIGGYSADATFAWRGHSSADFPLVSSLQRVPGLNDEDLLRAREKALIGEAREWGLGFGSAGWLTDFQLLADLQHYGSSTRLIDVTNNPMTALWFACQPAPQGGQPGSLSNDGLLLAINTVGWQRFGRAQPGGSSSAVTDPISWELDHALREDSPFIVESLTPNERLRAQEGFFITARVPEAAEQSGPFQSIHLVWDQMDSRRLKRELNDSRVGTGRKRLPFVAVLIPARLKAKVLIRLENSYNRRARVLFPDFPGFRDFADGVEARASLHNDE